MIQSLKVNRCSIWLNDVMPFSSSLDPYYYDSTTLWRCRGLQMPVKASTEATQVCHNFWKLSSKFQLIRLLNYFICLGPACSDLCSMNSHILKLFRLDRFLHFVQTKHFFHLLYQCTFSCEFPSEEAFECTSQYNRVNSSLYTQGTYWILHPLLPWMWLCSSYLYSV